MVFAYDKKNAPASGDRGLPQTRKTQTATPPAEGPRPAAVPHQLEKRPWTPRAVQREGPTLSSSVLEATEAGPRTPEKTNARRRVNYHWACQPPPTCDGCGLSPSRGVCRTNVGTGPATPNTLHGRGSRRPFEY